MRAVDREEAWELAKAWLLVSAAFYFLFFGATLTVLGAVLVLFVSAGAVIFHELGHKYVALRYGCDARFVANDGMLLLGVAMSLFGFVFLAPGAVRVRGIPGVRANTLIAWAGPAVNAVLGAIAYVLIGVTGITGYFSLILRINALIGVFNMIPLPGFDGEKIWAGDRSLYLATTVILGLLTATSFSV